MKVILLAVISIAFVLGYVAANDYYGSGGGSYGYGKVVPVPVYQKGGDDGFMSLFGLIIFLAILMPLFMNNNNNNNGGSQVVTVG